MNQQKPITVSEAKDILEAEGKKRELNFEQKAALQHSGAFAKLTAADSRKLVGELLKIENMTEPLAVKIADVLPQHPDDVRVIFSKERFALDQKVIDSVIKAVEGYL